MSFFRGMASDISSLSQFGSRSASRRLTCCVDVSGGDKIPRKAGPGITQSDLLVINKTDLAPLIGADLDIMARDSRHMRGDGPCVFAQVTNGAGLDTITGAVVEGLEATRARTA